MKVILGIDAAWTNQKPSGVAVVVVQEGNCRCAGVAPSYRSFLDLARGIPVDWAAAPEGGRCDAGELLEATAQLAGSSADVVAVDMPLSPEPLAGRRAAERMINKEFAARWCATHSPTKERPGRLGATLTRDFLDRGYELATETGRTGKRGNLVEVYPHPALLALLNEEKRVPYKVDKSNTYWKKTSVSERIVRLLTVQRRIEQMLQVRLGVTGLPVPHPAEVSTLSYLKKIEDALDALICCWVGVLFLKNEVKPYGDESGAIWCPAADFSR